MGLLDTLKEKASELASEVSGTLAAKGEELLGEAQGKLAQSFEDVKQGVAEKANTKLAEGKTALFGAKGQA